MSTTIEQVKTLLDNLPENSSIEDIQYHLYVVTKIQNGIERAGKEGVLNQEEIESRNLFYYKQLPL